MLHKRWMDCRSRSSFLDSEQNRLSSPNLMFLTSKIRKLKTLTWKDAWEASTRKAKWKGDFVNSKALRKNVGSCYCPVGSIRCFVAASPYVASVDTEQGPVSSVFKIEFSMNLLLLWEQYKKCVRYSCTLRIKTKCYEAQTSRTSSFNLTEINVYWIMTKASLHSEQLRIIW